MSCGKKRKDAQSSLTQEPDRHWLTYQTPKTLQTGPSGCNPGRTATGKGKQVEPGQTDYDRARPLQIGFDVADQARPSQTGPWKPPCNDRGDSDTYSEKTTDK